jgi:hypothetical protein
VPPITQASLLLIERQTHLGEPPATLREYFCGPRTAENHKIVRVGDEPRPVPLVEPPESKDSQVPIHVDQGKQRRNDSSRTIANFAWDRVVPYQRLLDRKS